MRFRAFSTLAEHRLAGSESIRIIFTNKSFVDQLGDFATSGMVLNFAIELDVRHKYRFVNRVISCQETFYQVITCWLVKYLSNTVTQIARSDQIRKTDTVTSVSLGEFDGKFFLR